jgi:hypothetical protein
MLSELLKFEVFMLLFMVIACVALRLPKKKERDSHVDVIKIARVDACDHDIVTCDCVTPCKQCRCAVYFNN